MIPDEDDCLKTPMGKKHITTRNPRIADKIKNPKIIVKY
jgi:hypothetical protein